MLYEQERAPTELGTVFQAGNTNWVKMSKAWRAVKGIVGCLDGNDGPTEESLSLSSAHCLQDY